MPVLILTFSEAGLAKFAGVQQGRIGENLEVTLDGELLFNPVLTERIEGEQITIAGIDDEAETKAMAERLTNQRWSPKNHFPTAPCGKNHMRDVRTRTDAPPLIRDNRGIPGTNRARDRPQGETQ